MSYILILISFLISFINLQAEEWNINVLDQTKLHKNTFVYFTKDWKFKPGDNREWASPELIDSNWAITNTYQGDSFNENWKGIGWFRLHFKIDSSLFNRSVSFNIWSAGSQEIFLDGNYITEDSGSEHINVITFSPKINHIIAVRYINNNIKFYKDAGFGSGFRIGFGDIENSLQIGLKKLKNNSDEQMFFTAITLAFGILHLILFLFNRKLKENLVYSVFLFVFASSIFFDYQTNVASSITELVYYLRVHRILMSFTQVLALLSLYSVLKQKTGISFKIILLYYAVAAYFVVLKPVDNFLLLQIGILFVFAECVRITIKTSKQQIEGVWIIALGFTFLFFFSLYDWLLDFRLIDRIWNLNNGYPFGALGLFICMSIFISKSFARSNQIIIQQEKLNNEKEIERKYLEAENKRKSLELEDARKLQLSILPKQFPELSDLEIYADMRTAAEVGGDYYDYHLTSEGIITLAVGDATGHGIKAGIMVTLIKSLFDAMAHTFFIPDFFNHCTKTIKKMNLGNLYMGMTILKIRDYKITASAAGMPPFLVYRQSTNSVEEIIMKGMPLGAFADFQYQQKIFKVSPGDVILLLTDGFVELFNPNMEMIDFDSVKNTFLNAARNNSNNIIDELFQAADQWLNGCKQTDDITFLVVKIK